jgi:hypothetical protein
VNEDLPELPGNGPERGLANLGVVSFDTGMAAWY